MDPAHFGVLIPIVALFIPMVAIWTKHEQKMAEIKARQGSVVAPEFLAEMNRLRAEVAALRDTSTHFDMSFDAAITRLEDRVDRIESQGENAPVAHRTAPVYNNGQTAPQQVTLGAGRGEA